MDKMHSRRDFLRKSILSSVYGTLFCSTIKGSTESYSEKNVLLEKAQSSRPNILFIFMDDLGWRDLGCYGHPVIKTPNIDKLAKQGCRLTNFYVTSPVCSPSRAGYLTGRIPNRFGMQGVIHAGNYTTQVYHHLPLEEPTYARQLKKAGYKTGLVGKWHLSILPLKNEPYPDEYGFDYFCIKEGGGSGYYEQPSDWIRNRKVVEGLIADWTAQLYIDESIRFIESVNGQPFMLNLWPWTPHEPLKTAERFKSMYPDRSEEEQTYFGAITQFDHELGRLWKYLDDNGLSNNTLVVFSSDNGPELMSGVLTPDDKVAPWGKYSRGSTLFRDRKHDIYEGGIRVPAIIRWPGIVKPDSVSHVPVSTLDMFPTFCAIANAPLPENVLLDGGDFRSAFKGKPVSRPHPLYWQYNYAAEAHRMYGIGSPPVAIRDGQWKLMSDFKFENVELYNLDIDPTEQWNFAKGYPEVTRKLVEELKVIYESVNKPYPSERYLNQHIIEQRKKQQKRRL